MIEKSHTGTRPAESCTCYQCVKARVAPADLSPWENAASIRRTSLLETFMLRRKDDSPAKTEQNTLPYSQAIPASNSDSCYQQTIGAQQNISNATHSGPPPTDSYGTLGSTSPTPGFDPEKFYPPEVPYWLKHQIAVTAEKMVPKAALLPTDAASRKKIPLYSGLVAYFPDALVAVASLSYVGNQQHNPGAKLHWDRTKSTDQEDTMLRHFFERGTVDVDGVRHSTKLAWRALAMLQLELENANR